MNLWQPLLILGAGGQGKVVADAADAAGAQSICFADDDYPATERCGPWSVIGKIELATLRTRFTQVHVAIGAGNLRERLITQALELGFELATVIHPSATVSKFAQVGGGSFIGPQASINVDAHLGRAVIVNTSASIDHDCRVADYAHIAPGAHLAGNVTVGTRSWIGLGAVVRGGIAIGADVTVGAGAAVVKHIADGLMVAGVPAKPLQRT